MIAHCVAQSGEVPTLAGADHVDVLSCASAANQASPQTTLQMRDQEPQ